VRTIGEQVEKKLIKGKKTVGGQVHGQQWRKKRWNGRRNASERDINPVSLELGETGRPGGLLGESNLLGGVIKRMRTPED